MDALPSGPLDPETASSLARALEPVRDLILRANAAATRTVGRNSLHELDSRHPLGRFVHELAQPSIGVCSDHLMAWTTLLEKMHPLYSHMTLLRSALESACHARWLLDADVTSAERIARGVSGQLEDWTERGKFEAAAGLDAKPRTTGKHGADRKRELEQLRKTNGITIRHVSVTETCRLYYVGGIGGEVAYRLASAFAHGRQWTALVSDLEDLDVPRLPTGARPMRMAARDDASIALTRQAVATFGAAVADLEAYARRRD